MITATTRRMWNLSETAEELGVSTKTIHKWLKAGIFPRPLRVGKVWRWKPEEIEAWMRERQNGAAR